MLSKENNLFCRVAFAILLVCIPLKALSAPFLRDDKQAANVRVIVLNAEKTFAEQLDQTNVIYVIKDAFDLRQNVTGLNLNTSFSLNNKRYYRGKNSISLQPGQGIWVPKGILLVDKSLNTIISKDGFYIADKVTSFYLCSSNNTKIDYKISSIVTIPEDCVLRFEGGVLNNGILRSVRTQIQAPPVQIFGENMYFGWYWDLEVAYPEWFGAKGVKTGDDGIAIQKCLDAFKKARLTNHQYYVSSTICVPAHGCLKGSGMYQTTVSFTQPIEDMICTENGIISTEIVISNLFLNRENTNYPIKRGIHVYSATKSRIESVSVAGAEVGFALNSFFGSQIKSCIAHDCKVGFYIGSEGGNSTSVDYDNCYANKCTTGHLFRHCSYVTTKNTSADFCDTAYDFVESCVTMISPGAEDCKFFATLIPHSEISQVGNYHSNSIHIINGQSIANEYNDKGVIYISTNTRGHDDRNQIVIDGFKIDFKDGKKTSKLLHKAGDTVLHLNGLLSTVQPDIEAVNYYRDGNAVLQNLSTIKYWTDKVVGTSVFIKSLNKPVFWNGVNWVDAAGAKLL